MKLPILAAIAATLAVAGTAAAQGNPVYGVQASLPPPGAFDHAQPAPDLGAAPNARRETVLASALHGYQLACEADRQALCADKHKGSPSDRCLVYHRLRLSASCKHAMDNLVLAHQGAL